MTVIESTLRQDERYEAHVEHWRSLMEDIRAEEEALRMGGGPERQAKQHAKGKLTARERIDRLCDPGAPFLEIGLWVAQGFYKEFGGAPAAGVVVGLGHILPAASDTRPSYHTDPRAICGAPTTAVHHRYAGDVPQPRIGATDRRGGVESVASPGSATD